MITLAPHPELGGALSAQKEEKEGANPSSAAAIHLPPEETHSNEAGESQDLWPRSLRTDQHIPGRLGSLPTERLSPTVTMIKCLSPLFYKYISFI